MSFLSLLEVEADRQVAALCRDPLPTFIDNLTRGAPSKHTTAQTSHITPLSRSLYAMTHFLSLRGQEAG